MTGKLRIGIVLSSLTALAGCWHDEQNQNLQRPNSAIQSAGDVDEVSLWTPKYIVVAADGDGYINLYGDDGAGKTQDYGAVQIKNDAGALGLGDVFIHQNHAFVLIPTGLRDANGNPNGGEYLWISNAGPDGSSVSDSVCRFNWNVVDTVDSDAAGNMDDVYKSAVEIRLGDGDKRGAPSHPVEGQAQPPLRFASCGANPNTQGGIRTDLYLGLSGFKNGWLVSGEFGVPIYQDLNGPQLKTTSLIQLSVMYMLM